MRKDVFNRALGIARNAKQALKMPLGVATNRSYQFPCKWESRRGDASERQRLQFDTSRKSQCHNEAWFRFCLLPLDILVTLECMFENISSSHNTAKQRIFYQAWNIKLLAKTWNWLKFPSRVISMVYCSMVATIGFAFSTSHRDAWKWVECAPLKMFSQAQQSKRCENILHYFNRVGLQKCFNFWYTRCNSTNFRSTAQRFSEAQFFMQFFRDLCLGWNFLITCFHPQCVKPRATKNFRSEKNWNGCTVCAKERKFVVLAVKTFCIILTPVKLHGGNNGFEMNVKARQKPLLRSLALLPLL